MKSDAGLGGEGPDGAAEAGKEKAMDIAKISKNDCRSCKAGAFMVLLAMKAPRSKQKQKLMAGEGGDGAGSQENASRIPRENKKGVQVVTAKKKERSPDSHGSKDKP